MKKNILVFGAGAIGRGYLPWIFDETKFDFQFVDANPKIIAQMRANKQFSTYRVHDGKMHQKTVPCTQAWTAGDFLETGLAATKDPAYIFVSVGPRNCLALGEILKHYDAPIILCENDPKTVDSLKFKTGKENYFFAIPDVITSNTAPQEILKNDSLALITESGTLFVDQAVGEMRGDCIMADKAELDRQWKAKLFLHNTPHCITAYLGALAGKTFVHESMAEPALEKITKGAMEEMLVALKRRWDMPHPFLDWYAEKELARFKDPLLHDPISRVAREPLRKLDLDGRLIGAAQICLEVGVIPNHIITGIISAILYEDSSDADSHIKMMRRSMPNSIFFSTILGLRTGEALETLMISAFDRVAEDLEKIRFRGRE